MQKKVKEKKLKFEKKRKIQKVKKYQGERQNSCKGDG